MNRVIVDEWQLGRNGSKFSEDLKVKQLSFKKVLDRDYVEAQIAVTQSTGRLFVIDEQRTEDVNSMSKDEYVAKYHSKKKEEPKEIDPKLLDAREKYEVLFGEAPHARMILKTLEAKILEKEQLDECQKTRVELISEYVENANELDLSGMENDAWETFYNEKKKSMKK